MGTIVVPPQYRSAAPRAVNGDGADADPLDHERPRVEGVDMLTWLGNDMGTYVTIVTDTVSRTLPKMAVMVLLERIVSNDMRRVLQKKAMSVRPCSARCSGATAVLHGRRASCVRTLFVWALCATQTSPLRAVVR